MATAVGGALYINRWNLTFQGTNPQHYLVGSQNAHAGSILHVLHGDGVRSANLQLILICSCQFESRIAFGYPKFGTALIA